MNKYKKEEEEAMYLVFFNLKFWRLLVESEKLTPLIVTVKKIINISQCEQIKLFLQVSDGTQTQIKIRRDHQERRHAVYSIKNAKKLLKTSTFVPLKSTNMLSMQNSNILITCSSVWHVLLYFSLLTKYISYGINK